MNREEQFDKVKDAIQFDMYESDKFNLYNYYLGLNKYNPIYLLNESEIEDFCNDSLSAYFEQVEHSSHFDMDDDYFEVDGNGWIKTFDEYDLDDKLTDEVVINYILDNWVYFEDDFEIDIFEEEED